MCDFTTEEQRSTAVASISWAYGLRRQLRAIGPLLGGMLDCWYALLIALRGFKARCWSGDIL